MTSVEFKVRRSKAVAVQPARPTPMEVKPLSDWDDVANFRQMVSVILLYKHSGTDRDPADTIKKALAEALVYYYPWAGRLKESLDGKLVVDCTAEGVVFVEADADVSLDQLGEEDSLHPIFPCLEEVLYAVNLTLGSPLFTMQVTRLLCGGFIVGLTYHHTISDAIGAARFLTTVSHFAGGAEAPSVLPIWQREELLSARGPPYLPIYATLHDNLYRDLKQPDPPQGDTASYCSFFFGAREVAAIRAHVPQSLRDSCTSFELIVACVLHCRVISLQQVPDEILRVFFIVNCREKFVDLLIPATYYGNAIVPAMLVCPAEDLYDLGRAVEKVKKAKEAVNEDYARSMLDICVNNRRSPSTNFPPPTCFFSDLSRVGFLNLDFGSWGKPVYVGRPGHLWNRHIATYMVPFTNRKGEKGRLLDLYLSKDAMEKFSITLRSLLLSN